MTVEQAITKRCLKCDTIKPAKEFGRNQASKDGLAAYCWPCSRAYHRSRRAVSAQTERGPGFKALSLRALDAERRLADAKADRRRVAAEHRALAIKVVAPALVALRAAVSALEVLFDPAPAIKEQATKPVKAPPARAPSSDRRPVSREIRTIMAEDNVATAEAKRIQKREIVARAEWRPRSKANSLTHE